jgi:hypothetical protein
MEIAEIITADGEVFGKEDLSDKKVQFNLLKHLDFNTVQEFYFNKMIMTTTREKETKSNGSNGATAMNILDNLKWGFIKPYVDGLIEKGYLIKRQSINSEMYFLKQKKK